MGRTESTAHRQRRLARHADAALYNPVWTSSVNSPGSFAVALVGFVLLTVECAVIVALGATGGVALALAAS